MEALRILDKDENLCWDYDEEADVLYISFGEPVEALGLDIGNGTFIRYRQATSEAVGVTIMGVRQRSQAAMAGKG
jgi:uncharacterized protein YuzE